MLLRRAALAPAITPTILLRIQTALCPCREEAAAGERIRSRTIEPLIDLAPAPEETCDILHPFEVTHGNATRIRQHIGYDEAALRAQNPIGVGSCWTVSYLDNHPRGNRRCIRGGDLRFESRGHSDDPSAVLGKYSRRRFTNIAETFLRNGWLDVAARSTPI